MRANTLAILGFALAWPGAALPVDFLTACKTKTLCAGVEPGGGRIIQCLKEHKAILSTKCKTAVGEFILNQPIRTAPIAPSNAEPAPANSGETAPPAPPSSGETAPPPQ